MPARFKAGAVGSLHEKRCTEIKAGRIDLRNAAVLAPEAELESGHSLQLSHGAIGWQRTPLRITLTNMATRS